MNISGFAHNSNAFKEFLPSMFFMVFSRQAFANENTLEISYAFSYYQYKVWVNHFQ